ncbi:MAG: hypothetical protein QE265_05830 [Rhodoferax sp.]|nr:hypothetical protein [Rhodoferax sp.]
MKFNPLILVLTLSASWNGLAQERIYRCGNEYTNTVTEHQAKSCKLVAGGNVTVVQARKPGTQASASAAPPAASTASKSGSEDQRAKDSDARLILESELKKAESRQQELLREYNNGEPERLGPETRNAQKYIDRVTELKAAIARNESDIAGIRRELGRLPAGGAKP